MSFDSLLGKSKISTESPFGQTPFRQAEGLGKQFADPLRKGLGFGGGPGFQRKLERALERGSPLAAFISGVRDIAPGVLGTTTGPGGQAQPGLLQQLQSQIGSFLENIPNLQQQAATTAEQAFNPARQSGLFQQASGDVLDQLTQRAAARGLAGTGEALGREQDALNDLALQFTLAQPQLQAQALNNLLGIGQAGISAAGQAAQAPTALAGQLFNLLQGGQQPGFNLLQATSPVSAVTEQQGILDAVSKLLGGAGGAASGIAQALAVCLHPSTKILTTTGWTEIHELTGKETVFTRDYGNRVIEAPIERMSKTPRDEQHLFICLQTAGGDIYVSGDHPIAGRPVATIKQGDVLQTDGNDLRVNKVMLLDDHQIKYTHDLLITAGTGEYLVHPGVWMQSTLDPRHQIG